MPVQGVQVISRAGEREGGEAQSKRRLEAIADRGGGRKGSGKFGHALGVQGVRRCGRGKGGEGGEEGEEGEESEGWGGFGHTLEPFKYSYENGFRV